MKHALGAAPVAWRATGHPAVPSLACGDVAGRSGSAVAICQHAQQCHSLARRLSGQFTSMEELESRDLLTAADAFDRAEGATALLELLAFARLCIARLPRAVNALRTGGQPSAQVSEQHPELSRALLALTHDLSPDSLLLALQAIERLPGIVVFRRELWCELQRAARIQRDESIRSLREAVLSARDRTRRYGRNIEPRSVSRTLLIKGLEYDHALVLNADALDATNLYVAMTRGRTSLTVLSARSRLAPRAFR